MLRNRLIALALFILSVIAISFYGGPVTYGFFFLTVLIPAISAAYCFLVYLRYRIYQVIVTKNVVVGSPTDYYFTLQNEDFYSFSGIKVEFFSDFSTINELDENNEYELMVNNVSARVILGDTIAVNDKLSRLAILLDKYSGTEELATYKTLNLKYNNQIVCTK